MIALYFSGDISEPNSGSAKYFRMLADQCAGELHSLGIPIETTTGYFLWQIDNNILKPDWIDKFFSHYLRSNFPKMYQWLLQFGPKVIAQRRFGPNHPFIGDLKSFDILIVGYMPFNIVKHIRKSLSIRTPVVSIPFFHAVDPMHQKLKSNLKAANKNITLSGAELSLKSGFNQHHLGAYLDEIWFKSPRDLENVNRPYRVIWVGRRESSKGAELFEQLAKSCAGPKVEFVAAGPGTEYFHGPITGLGRLSESELIELYDSSNLYVHTGAFESYSYSTVQSWARNVPVICLASNIATAQMVRESKGGWLVDDLNSLIQKTKELIQNPDNGGVFANNGYRWAVENASWKAYNSRVSTFLSEIKSLNHAQPS